MSKKIMLYGANGYTSRLIIKELVGQNIKPILAGRNQEKINSLADKHGFQFCIFSLNDSNWGGTFALVYIIPDFQRDQPLQWR